MFNKVKERYNNSTVLRNFSLLTVSNILTQVLGISTSIKIARFVSPTVFGTYNLLQLHVSVFVVIASLGLKNIVVRMISRDKLNSKKVFFASLLLKSFILLVAIIAYVIYYHFINSYNYLLFILVILSIIALSTFDIIEGVAFGLERMEFTSIIALFINLLWIVVLLAIPGKFYSLNLLFELYFILNALKTLIYFGAIYRARSLTGSYNERELKVCTGEMLSQSLPYYYLVLLTLLSNQIPILFLEYRSGVDQVGFFNIANKILTPMNLILNTALIALFPNLSKLYVTNLKLFSERVKNIFIVISVLGILGAFTVTFFRTEAISIIYGKKYITSSLVLSYQCWYMALYSLVCLIGTLLGAIDRQKELSYLSIICTLFQVPILWVGAKYGAEYLSAAFLVATAIGFIMHSIVINKFLKQSLELWFILKILIFFIAAYFVSVLIPIQLNFFIKLTMFTILSSGGLFFLYKKLKVMKSTQ